MAGVAFVFFTFGGVMIDVITIDTQPKKLIFGGLISVLQIVFGRVWGKESERLRPGGDQ